MSKNQAKRSGKLCEQISDKSLYKKRDKVTQILSHLHNGCLSTCVKVEM